MSRITVDTKCRLCRAEGNKLFLKGARCLSAKCPIEKKGAVSPGMHGLKRQSKPTDYGIQLRAKQKAKRIYGVSETPFKNYYLKAKKLKGQVGGNLMILLERRLDNVIFVAGLSISRPQARQFISHNHVLVNGKPLSIPSYNVRIGDIISLDQEISKKFADSLRLDNQDFTAPSWLEVDKAKKSVKITSLPLEEEIQQGIDVNLIIEYYSR